MTPNTNTQSQSQSVGGRTRDCTHGSSERTRAASVSFPPNLRDACADCLSRPEGVASDATSACAPESTLSFAPLGLLATCSLLATRAGRDDSSRPRHLMLPTPDSTSAHSGPQKWPPQKKRWGPSAASVF